LNPKYTKIANIYSRRLAVVHHRQAVHNKIPELVKLICVAWRSGMYRQAVPSQEPRIGELYMRRLAAMNSPPGGF